MQSPGIEFAARDARWEGDEDTVQFTLDIAGAYPPEAGLESWVRSVVLRRGQEVEISDAYELNKPARELTLSVLTPCEVSTDVPGVISLTAASLPGGRVSGLATLRYDPEIFEVVSERVPIADQRLGGVWGTHLVRLLFTQRDPPREGMWTVTLRPGAR